MPVSFIIVSSRSKETNLLTFKLSTRQAALPTLRDVILKHWERHRKHTWCSETSKTHWGAPTNTDICSNAADVKVSYFLLPEKCPNKAWNDLVPFNHYNTIFSIRSVFRKLQKPSNILMLILFNCYNLLIYAFPSIFLCCHSQSVPSEDDNNHNHHHDHKLHKNKRYHVISFLMSSSRQVFESFWLSKNAE